MAGKRIFLAPPRPSNPVGFVYTTRDICKDLSELDHDSSAPDVIDEQRDQDDALAAGTVDDTVNDTVPLIMPRAEFMTGSAFVCGYTGSTGACANASKSSAMSPPPPRYFIFSTKSVVCHRTKGHYGANIPVKDVNVSEYRLCSRC